MNRIIPIFNPLEINRKCDPCLVVSFEMLNHQRKADEIIIKLNTSILIFMLLENPHRIYVTMFHEIMAFRIGHGLGVTI